MDVNFKLIIILCAAALLLILLVDAWFKERRLQTDNNMDCLTEVAEPELKNESAPIVVQGPVSKMVAKQDSPHSNIKDDFIIINVIAKNGEHFASYDLLQAISATGMQYGSMNIFHFIEESPRGKLTLFSLASATEPGEFDLNNVGNLTCAGLTLFMNISRVPDPGDVFILMLETAEQLAEDLHGELRAAPNIPWSEDIYHHYENKIVNHQKLI